MKRGSRVTAVGIRAAGFERRVENGGGRLCARRLEFAQGVHRLRTVASWSSQFSVLSCHPRDIASSDRAGCDRNPCLQHRSQRAYNAAMRCRLAHIVILATICLLAGKPHVHAQSEVPEVQAERSCPLPAAREQASDPRNLNRRSDLLGLPPNADLRPRPDR